MHIADRFVVVLDANVLFPFRKRDVLLRFSHAGLFRARWSEDILDEWMRYLLALKPQLEDSIRVQQAAMREGLAIEVDFSLPSERVVRTLNQVVAWRGKPRAIRVDNVLYREDFAV